MDENTVFSYRFVFDNGDVFETMITLDEHLRLKTSLPAGKPDWARMENFRCPHCPLPEDTEYCPLAIALPEQFSLFNRFPSYQAVKVSVHTPARDYQKETDLQSGVSSLMGILMVSSGCPIMGKLKPMLRFHLPFASLEETRVRALSIYLLAQYIKLRRSGEPDWDMTGLIKIYDDIRDLNMSVADKIRSLLKSDTGMNSLVILNNFANYISFTLDEKLLDHIEEITAEFLQ